MKNYEKPIVMINEDMAEGVYAASGDCWTITTKPTNPWSGKGQIFEVKIVHSTGLQHISTASTVVLTFNHPIVSASAQEYSCSVSGNTVTITRERLGDAYDSGDQATYNVEVCAADEATSRALVITSSSISCSKAVNVQGGGLDEIH